MPPNPANANVAENAPEAEDAKPNFSVSAPNVNLAKPLEISKRPEDIALCEKINQTIEQSEFANARWGVFVASLKDGRVTCARDARQLFNPASIEKTLTSIVALALLDTDYRFRTSVFAENQIQTDGTLSGDLILYGRGAPDFDDDSLQDLINQLQAKGLKRVKGNIIGDESYFKGENIGDGWTWNELQWHYGAEAGALSFRENQASVYMQDGRAVASTDFLTVENDLKPAGKDAPEGFGIKRGLEDNQVYLWGSGDKAFGKLSVHNPALWTAKTFKDALEKRGIGVEGEARSVNWRTENKTNVESAAEFAFVESKPLAELIERMNKHSVNIYGELLLRALGKKFGDSAPDENRQMQAVRGDDAAGAAVVKNWLRGKNIATEGVEIRDGSGLSRLDFVTPEVFARAMIAAAQSNFAAAFENSLPISGTDGTLGGRLWNVKGKILAKTGSVTFVNSLTGYAQGADEIFAFAIISNNVTRKSDSSRIIDKIAQSLVKPDANEKEAPKTEKTRTDTSKPAAESSPADNRR